MEKGLSKPRRSDMMCVLKKTCGVAALHRYRKNGLRFIKCAMPINENGANVCRAKEKTEQKEAPIQTMCFILSLSCFWLKSVLWFAGRGEMFVLAQLFESKIHIK